MFNGAMKDTGIGKKCVKDDASAQKNWDIITKVMTKEQIAEAQSLSTEIYNRIEANKKD